MIIESLPYVQSVSGKWDTADFDTQFGTPRTEIRSRRDAASYRETYGKLPGVMAKWLDTSIEWQDRRMFVDAGLYLVVAPKRSGKTAFARRLAQGIDSVCPDMPIRYIEMGEPETAYPFPITWADVNRFKAALWAGGAHADRKQPGASNDGVIVVPTIDDEIKYAALINKLSREPTRIYKQAPASSAEQVWLIDSLSLAYASQPVSALPPTSGGYPTGLVEFLYNAIHCVAKKRNIVIFALMNPIHFSVEQIKELGGHIAGMIVIHEPTADESQSIDSRIEQGEIVPFKAEVLLNITTDGDVMWRPKSAGWEGQVTNILDAFSNGRDKGYGSL